MLFRSLWPYSFASFTGVLTAYLDMHSDDPQLAVLLLFAFGLFLGSNLTAHNWRHGLFLGLWIPFTQFLRIIPEGRLDAIVGEGLFSLLALIPAMLGVSLGSVLRSRSNVNRAA